MKLSIPKPFKLSDSDQRLVLDGHYAYIVYFSKQSRKRVMRKTIDLNRAYEQARKPR